MSQFSEEIMRRASEYAQRRGLVLSRSLGFGKDGSVLGTDQATAVKIHERRNAYSRELKCYQRLLELKVE